ncbi:hypothetical protein SCHPADRAFT_743676 [Schizopora paradoxa]|uniref:EF-hand domain-containing protein n=1 Tax=Schizopora paradoxa TaxID=27342 RepID=A0A0H2R0R6_9AGAM|nr:hypothetical protein SCHPADRAFT_743676 [Schizopora paradoxa]
MIWKDCEVYEEPRRTVQMGCAETRRVWKILQVLSHEVTESYYEVFVLFDPLGNGVFDLKGCLLALKEISCPHPSPMNRIINILGSECGSFPSLIPVCKMRSFFENISSFSVVAPLVSFPARRLEHGAR